LQPLQVIEDTARRVSDGHFDARVGVLPGLADGNLARIAQTLDGLLDRVASERARVRTLAAQVVKAGDAERARIARELHDGTAQQLTALEMLLTSAQADAPQSALAERLSLMHSIATESLAEVRNLSHTVHPRVLDDLGLPAALEWLARRSGAPELTVHVLCEVDGQIPAPLASVLYRVTQEALQNAIRHGAARHVDVTVRHVDGCVELRIEDDGRGFDGARPPADAASGLDGVPTGRQPGMGLFVMQERVSLLDGQLTIDSRPGAGTRILARLPFGDRT
jgi:signal transduction histidine kinase